ncbi:MAG: hypothetical protein WDA16_06505 [Candidatus Thermoplasmatota archaeon]
MIPKRLTARKAALAGDERALAGAIGIILMLAVAVTVYAHTVRGNIPVYGEQAEHAWDERVSTAFQDLGRSIAGGISTGAPVTGTIPAPPPPEKISLPFLGSAGPVAPAGTVAFAPACTRASVLHTLGSGQIVTDLAGGSNGCLTFHATTLYSPPFGYAIEMGGVLRVQGQSAVILAGPPLQLDPATPTEYRIALALPGLRGSAASASADSADVHVDVVPGPSASEVEQEPNAARATWTFDTSHPAAWKTWLDARFVQAGLVASRASPLPGQSSSDYSIACVPVDCSTAAGGGQVNVVIEGPRTDMQDIRLSITYGLADVSIR